jgi:succinate dehydrogenase hydrophobic anchor subunit
MALLMHFLATNLKPSNEASFMQRFSSGLINNRWAILTVTALVCAATAPLIGLNLINDDYIKYFDKKTGFRASNDYIQKT